jgi:hypothetical protein
VKITLELKPDLEKALIARAEAKGQSLRDYAEHLLEEDAAKAAPDPALPDNLYDLLAPVRGLLSDEEIDRYFARTPSQSRPVDLE